MSNAEEILPPPCSVDESQEIGMGKTSNHQNHQEDPLTSLPLSTSVDSSSSATSSSAHEISSSVQKPLATFNQIPFLTLSDRVDKGTKVCVDLHGVMRGRLDILDNELRFSDKISRINIYENEMPLSSSEKSILASIYDNDFTNFCLKFS